MRMSVIALQVAVFLFSIWQPGIWPVTVRSPVFQARILHMTCHLDLVAAVQMTSLLHIKGMFLAHYEDA